MLFEIHIKRYLVVGERANKLKVPRYSMMRKKYTFVNRMDRPI